MRARDKAGLWARRGGDSRTILHIKSTGSSDQLTQICLQASRFDDKQTLFGGPDVGRMFIQKKHKVARAARGRSGDETYFFSRSVLEE